MATVATPMTTEELLALPDDGVDRWLIEGELRERPMTVRNRIHSCVMTKGAFELEGWRLTQPPPRGQVLTGDAGVRLKRGPDSTFGIDIIYVSAELLAQQTDQSTIIAGAPTLAIEILSPNDVMEDVNDKIDALLAAKVPLVWIIDPRRRTVTIHRPNAEPELVNVRQELVGDPLLPGLRLPVARLFE